MFRTVSATRAELRRDVHQHFESAHQAFLAVDVNRDGRIQVEEIERILDIYNLPVEQAKAVLSRADRDGDGRLDYSEFCREFFGAPSPAKARPQRTSTAGAHETSLPSALTPVSTNQPSGSGRQGTAKDLGRRLRQHYSSAAKAFLKLDQDRSGFVAAGELRAIEKEYNMPVGEIISKCDMDGDGRLSFDEVAKCIFAR